MDLVFASDVMMYSLCLTCNVKINSLTLDVSTHIIRVMALTGLEEPYHTRTIGWKDP